MSRIAIVLLVVAACGKGSSSGGKVASCLSESMHSCVEYNDANLAIGSDHIAKLCTTLDSAAKFAMTACPTANVIGTCKRNEGKDVFYTGYANADGVAESCKAMGGTFSK
jgi:hypothetical protein